MDELLWRIIEAERAADECYEGVPDEDLAPVVIDDGEGGVIAVCSFDGSYSTTVDGALA